MRRKLSPSPLDAGSRVARPLAPARASTALPTVAALAVALAALGSLACSMPMEDGVRPDPVFIVKSPAPVASSAAPAPPALHSIEPSPADVDGEMPMVKPKPLPSSTPKPYVAGPKPSGIHRTAGKPAIVHPSTF